MSRRWKQPVAHSKALPCQFLADEARAALPSATQRRPHSARAGTARTVRRSRRKESREEVSAIPHYPPPHSHTAQEMDVQWVDGQNSAASIVNAREDDNGSVHSCDTSWVSHIKSLNIPLHIELQEVLAPVPVILSMENGLARNNKFRFQTQPTSAETLRPIQVVAFEIQQLGSCKMFLISSPCMSPGL